MTGAAPLWICFLPQFVSVLGDCLGQRGSRVFHHHSRRRFLIALVGVTSLQMFFVLTVFQLAAPSLTTPITEKRNGTTYDYCASEPGKSSEYCYSQGPLTIYRALDLCPMLLLDGVLNVVYYIGEATMYKQSLGVLLLVLCALTSSFIVAPLQSLFGLQHAPGPGALPVVMGIGGALMCLIERKVVDPDAVAENSDGGDDGGGKQSPAAIHERDGSSATGSDGRIQVDVATSISSDSLHSMHAPPQQQQQQQHCREGLPLVAHHNSSSPGPGTAWHDAVRSALRAGVRHVPLLIPFSALSVTYATYFVLMDYYNSQCKTNLWGYNAFDQVTLPLYVYSLFAVVDAVAPCKRALEAEVDQHESFVAACRGAFHELFSHRGAGFVNMFVYRLLINARAMAYTYIATSYNLAASYLELTLIRVVVSWIASLLLVLFIPRFIHTAPVEQAQMKDKVNVALKVVGTAAILGSLIIIHQQSS